MTAARRSRALCDTALPSRSVGLENQRQGPLAADTSDDPPLSRCLDDDFRFSVGSIEREVVDLQTYLGVFTLRERDWLASSDARHSSSRTSQARLGAEDGSSSAHDYDRWFVFSCAARRRDQSSSQCGALERVVLDDLVGGFSLGGSQSHSTAPTRLSLTCGQCCHGLTFVVSATDAHPLGASARVSLALASLGDFAGQVKPTELIV